MTADVPFTLDTIPEKLAWLDERYWELGHDEVFEDYLRDLYEVDEEGAITGVPRRDPLTSETRGLMICAGSGSGKTATLRRALRANPVLSDAKNSDCGNTLMIEVPPDATIKSLAEKIAVTMGYTKIDKRVRASEAWDIARHRLVLGGINTLIIDECHHMFRPGPGRDISGAIQALKHLLQSDHAVALIILGVPELRDAILQEPSGETYRRFDEYHLPTINPGSSEAVVFDRSLTFTAEKLGVTVSKSHVFAERILFAEHGEKGRSVKLAKDIIREAVIKKREVLSLADADRIFKKRSGEKQMTPFNPCEWGVVKPELEAMGWVR